MLKRDISETGLTLLPYQACYVGQTSLEFTEIHLSWPSSAWIKGMPHHIQIKNVIFNLRNLKRFPQYRSFSSLSEFMSHLPLVQIKYNLTFGNLLENFKIILLLGPCSLNPMSLVFAFL